MKKLTCIIVDDEPVARKILQQFVEQLPFVELLGKFESAAQAEIFLRTESPDLMFLDIEMPKISGLDLLNKLEVKPMVILTTAFPQYALAGYEFDIIDYLLKPFAMKRFIKAVQKAKDFHEMKYAKSDEANNSYIFIRCEKRIEKIELKDILYVESLCNYVTIYTETKKFIAYLTLKSLQSQLPSSGFIKIHQSYLVNCTRITSIEANEVKLNGKSLPISRNYKDTIMKLVHQRLMKR